MKLNLEPPLGRASIRALFAFSLAFAGLQGLHAGGRGSGPVLTVYGVKGPSGVAMMRMFENPPRADGYEIRLEALPDAALIAGRLISGEAEIGMLPPNTAAKIAASGKNLQIAAVTGTGMLSLLSSDGEVNGMEDLRGKRVELANAGAVPDYVFRRLLLDRGIEPGTGVALGYSLSPPEIAASLISGRVSTALLPEPFATMALSGSPRVRRIGDIQEEWRRTFGGDFPMTVLAVDGDFAAANPLAMDAVLASLEESVAWVKANPLEAGVLAEKYGMGVSAQAAASAVPRSNYAFIPAAGARPQIEALFRVFMQFSPESIGAMPPDAFYYKGRL